MNIIKSVSFKNYRNLEETTVELNKGINIIYGNNGMGKTNFLETIFLCSTGRSHRTHKISSLINFEKDSAGIVLYKDNGIYLDKISINLKKNEKKGIAINGIPLKKVSGLFGVLKTVIFSPEDMGLINDGPNARRRFMDMEICQLSRVYCYNLEQYFKVLRQRNNLLKEGGKNIKDTLFVWNTQLVEYGRKIIYMREKFIKKILPFCKSIYLDITGGKEVLEIVYKPESTLKEFESRLNKSIERDIFYKTTHNGPHKDDIIFKINGNDARLYGSQGQKKSAVLALKLSEINVIKEETGEMPVLLLDDILSELDSTRQRFILKNVSNMQVILTCTGIDEIVNKSFDADNKKNINVFYINYGKISVKNDKNVL